MKKNKLFNAIQTDDAFTENGMPTNSTSGSSVLDLYFKMGGSRSMSESELIGLFVNSLNEDILLTIKAMFYNRDIRGGQGERRSFRWMFNWLCYYRPYDSVRLIHLVPEYGRWDDLFAAIDTPVQDMATSYLYKAILDGNVLAKKWCPRDNKKNKEIAYKLMSSWDMTPREYRNFISNTGEVVEDYMCKGRWSEINYNHVPSVASKNYRSAFGKHDAERYGDWLSKLEKGDKSVKINAGAIFPHDIVLPYLNKHGGIDRTLEAQWKALPDFLNDEVSFLPVVDTSGSMETYKVWHIAFALGLYLAERNKSIFKDGYVTFSQNAKLITLGKKTLKENVDVFVNNSIVANTNIESVYDLILTKAKQAGLSQEDLPTHLLILSDMQFDEGVENRSHNAQRMVESKFENAGYKAPQIVYWNLRSGNGVPVKFDEKGTCLVSGFSPSIMKSLLAGELTPENMMLSVLNGERYQAVEDALRG